MKQLLFVITALMMLGIPANAQNNAPKNEIFPFETPQILRAHYQETKHIPSLSNPLHSKGIFVYMKGKGLLWDMSAPFNMQTLITPNGLYQWVDGKEQPQSQSTQKAMQPILNNISDIFAGNIEALNNHFDVTERTDGDARTITLTPTSDYIKPYLQSIKVHGTKYIENITITYGQDKFTLIEYTSPQTDKKNITDKELKFFE